MPLSYGAQLEVVRGSLGVSAGLARVLAFVWGSIWGSFVNVVVHRLPRGMSIVRPESHCPACGKPIAPFDNVPILSWLLLRGTARCCGARISARYAVVELTGGVLALAVAELVLHRELAEAGDPLLHAASVFLADFALSMALLSAAFIDAEHMYVPDAITLGATAFGVATAGLRSMSWPAALFGAAVGFVAVWAPFIVGYKAIRGRPGMGLGDAKLLMVTGAWFGWQGSAFAVFAGALQATLVALVIVLWRGRIEEPEAVRADREALVRAAASGDEDAKKALEEDPLATPPGEGVLSARMPFGPFLCLATIEWMLFAERIRALVPFSSSPG